MDLRILQVRTSKGATDGEVSTTIIEPVCSHLVRSYKKKNYA